MANVTTEDYSGAKNTHAGVETVGLYNEAGDEEVFVHESLVATPVEKTVEVDWSGGDMVVTPEAGQAFSGVNIPVPANLIPSNIAEGVNIAGIIGTLVVGSGSGDVVVATGEVTPTSDGVTTITHNLGVAPDVFFVAAKTAVGEIYPIISTCNYSAALISKTGKLGWIASSVINGAIPSSTPLDGSGEGFGVPRDATPTTVDVGDTLYLQSGKKYSWVAIGGLT